jgi:ADP-heptose:LPS heptosyltransferase
VGVVVEPQFAAVFQGHPAVGEVLAPDLAAVRGFRAKLCVNLHGGTRSMKLTALSGARFRAGYAHHAWSTLYSEKIPTAQEVLGVKRRVHTAEHLASAMFHLGVPQGEVPRASLPATPEPSRKRPYAVLHPFASTALKQWPEQRFIELAAGLRQQGLTPVFIGTAQDQFGAFAGFEQAAGQSLPETMGLIRGAALFVGNDSGPAHLAAAAGTPAVVLFGPSDMEIWRPWKAHAEALLAPDANLERLSVDAVRAAIARLEVTA